MVSVQGVFTEGFPLIADASPPDRIIFSLPGEAAMRMARRFMTPERATYLYYVANPNFLSHKNHN